MLATEKEKLKERMGRYISLGITENGECRSSYWIPWEHTISAMNMKLPNVYLSKDDLKDAEIFSQLSQCHVIGCYIFTPLENYDVLAQFHELRDLAILSAEHLTSLSFLHGVEDLAMLYLENAHIQDLDAAFPPGKLYPICHRCLGLYHCEVDHPEAIFSDNLFFSELLLWKPVLNQEEKQLWKKARAHTFRYYITGNDT
ncbi:MAG: hypothetical protein Q4E24_15930 [bacterium]|nr:hypothetical protein [bacterium]